MSLVRICAFKEILQMRAPMVIIIIIILITFRGSFFFPPPSSHTLPGVTANVLAHLQAKTYSFPFQGCIAPPLPVGV